MIPKVRPSGHSLPPNLVCVFSRLGVSVMSMKQQITRLALAIGVAGVLAACGGGGDVKLSANSSTTINDNSTTTTAASNNNPCANYLDSATNTRKQGSFDGTNCVYSTDFVGETNPLTVNLTIPFISGVHIFEDSLFVGKNVDGTNAAEAVLQNGAGPTLTIRAGNRLAWTRADDYLLVNRGSRIVAEGTATTPITLTGFKDAVSRNAGRLETQLWGGVVINGNGITNRCSDAQRTANTCHVLGEGKPSNYGGNNNAESSGTLQYVLIKHPGFEVAPGDELNGLTLNAVGSGTTIQNVEVYSTYDDGVEFFGGAVNVSNLVALYVADDAIDWADGWVGTVDRALVIQAENNGDRCIEADNGGTVFDLVPPSNGTVKRLTCITSGAKLPIAIHGDSMGAELRRGTRFKIEDSIFYDAYAINRLNQVPGRCLRVTDTQSAQAAQAGNSSVKSNLLACRTPTSNGTNWTTVFSNGDSVASWTRNNGVGAYPNNTNNVFITDSTNANVRVLDSFFTATQFVDAAGVNFSITPVTAGPIGAVTRASNWTASWTFGLDNTLWF